MSRHRLQLYGWYIPKTRQFRVSRLPPDAPVRPSILMDNLSEVTALVERKRATILWWPPLPQEAMQTSFHQIGEAS